eukprot:8939105-Lingulodinium_polyedra.AAC.1
MLVLRATMVVRGCCIRRGALRVAAAAAAATAVGWLAASPWQRRERTRRLRGQQRDRRRWPRRGL